MRKVWNQYLCSYFLSFRSIALTISLQITSATEEFITETSISTALEPQDIKPFTFTVSPSYSALLQTIKLKTTAFI